MLPDLFRIGRCEGHGWRPAMAELHGAGRVLPEWAAPDLDRLVHAAFSALVPCGDGVWNAGAGTHAGVDDVSAETIANFVLSDPDPVADRHHSLSELHILELPRPGPGDFTARRRVRAALLAAIPEGELPRH